MIYYIADTHFGDERIMRLAGRPFSDVSDMNETMIKNWNNVVSQKDTVYILGDFALNNNEAECVKRLNGQKILILGNHDRELTIGILKNFRYAAKMKTITDNGRMVCLCHYPLASFDNSVYGGYHVYGHIHNNTKDAAYKLMKNVPHAFNASADVIGFTPKTLDELINLQGKGNDK